MPRRLLYVPLVGTLLLLPLCVADWGALHDLWWDYASPQTVARFTEAGVDTWPVWTRAAGEWSMVRASLLARLAIVVVNVVVLTLVLRRMRRSVNDEG